jgi:drug/metabolite transporter (DMT)-like permease
MVAQGNKGYLDRWCCLYVGPVITSGVEAPTSLPGVEPAGRRPGSVLGAALCLISATAFGLAALFAKQCFAAGFSVPAMLAGRFGIAAVVFWLIVAVRRPARPGPRLVLSCLALGGVGYAVQAACYFSALTRIDASLVGQVLYVYPAIVVALALLLRRESISRAKLAALCCALVGLVVLLGYAGSNGPVAPAGVLLAFCSALTYALYITVATACPQTSTSTCSRRWCAAVRPSA